MRFQAVKSRRLADEIADRIRHFILEGSLRPGDRLPAERQLAEEFNTSRPTLREALIALEEEGLLKMQRGGVHVADASERSIRDPLVSLLRSDPNIFDDYLEFRGVMEGAAAYFAALRATDLDRDTLRRAFSRLQECHERADPVEEARVDADFHIAIYESCHNLTILHVMRGLSELLCNDVFYNRKTLYPRVGYREATLQQHRAIFEAIVAGDPAAAQRAAESHIAFVRQALDELKKSEARLEIALRRVGASLAPGGES